MTGGPASQVQMMVQATDTQQLIIQERCHSQKMRQYEDLGKF